jgi:hypothetical protein
MTVATENCVVGYIGNGVNKNFAFAFLIQDAGSLKLYLNGVLVPSNYSVTGFDNPAGGSVTYPVTGAAILASDYLEIIRDVAYTQQAVFSNQGAFSPASVEDALDQLALQTQQLAAAALLRYSTSGLPSAKRKGQLVFNLDLSVPVYSDGTNWRKLSDNGVVA